MNDYLIFPSEPEIMKLLSVFPWPAESLQILKTPAAN